MVMHVYINRSDARRLYVKFGAHTPGTTPAEAENNFLALTAQHTVTVSLGTNPRSLLIVKPGSKSLVLELDHSHKGYVQVLAQNNISAWKVEVVHTDDWVSRTALGRYKLPGRKVYAEVTRFSPETNVRQVAITGPSVGEVVDYNRRLYRGRGIHDRIA